MPMSQEWYDNPSNPRLIIAIVGVYSSGVHEPAGETLKYLTNSGFNTLQGDVSFLPFITGSLRVSESLSEEGSISMSYGDIEILNSSGELDSWLDGTGYIWVNRSVNIYYSDQNLSINNVSEIASTCDLVFSGVVADIDSRSRNVLNIKIRDKMERLNTPVSEDVLGTYGTWSSAQGQTNQDNIKPIIIGEPHNFQPLLIDPAQLEYWAGVGPLEQITEIRDNGVPVYTVGVIPGGATVNLTTGKFKLTKPIVGECTVSAQGLKKSLNLVTGVLENSYNNTIANAIAILVTQYGNTATRLLVSEIDLSNFNNFNTQSPQAIGVYVNSRENLLSLCQQVASSVGAQIYFTRVGKLRILRYGVPSSTPTVFITPEDMHLNSFSTSGRSQVLAAKKVGYAKNWYVQENLVTAIPQEHKYMFGTETWSKTSNDSTNVKTLYKLHSEPAEKPTYLIEGADAAAEALRLNNYFGLVRTKYRFTGFSKLLTIELGQQVHITYPRFGLQEGKNFQVVGLNPDWLAQKVDIEVVSLDV